MCFKCSPWERTGLEPKKGEEREDQVETAPWVEDAAGQGRAPTCLPVAGLQGKATWSKMEKSPEGLESQGGDGN